MSYDDDREPNPMPYDWSRLATEAAVIRNCEALGAVDLRDHVSRPERVKQRDRPGFGAVGPFGGPSHPYDGRPE